MKRKIALIMCVALMTVCFAGCDKLAGKNEPESLASTTDKIADKNEPESSTDTTDEISDENNSVSLVGTTDETTYKNEAFGFEVTLDGWNFKTKSEIEQITGASAELIENEELSEAVAKSYTDMYATNSGDMDTVQVLIESLGVQGKGMSEKAYVESSLSTAKNEFEYLGMKIDVAEVDSVTFAGETHSALRLKGSISGLEFEQTQVIVKKDGDFCVICIGSFSGMDIDEIIDSFEKI